MDSSLASCGIPISERQRIYEILAAILHLGNICFEESVLTGKCIFTKSSIIHVVSVAKLLGIDQITLESALLTRAIHIKGSDQIMYAICFFTKFIKFL